MSQLSLAHVARFVRTVTPLRPRQIWGRVAYHAKHEIERRLALPGDATGHAIAPAICWQPRATWPRPELRQPRGLTDGTYDFAGVVGQAGPPRTWGSLSAPKLWRYHLHYHAFLYDFSYEEAREFVFDYIGDIPAEVRREAWESYPLSLRLGNWTTLFFGRWCEQTLADPAFSARLWQEVRRMANWLSRHLETHLLANHYLENAIALALAGSCFRTPEAARWYEVAVDILSEQLPEQILADGGHFERSPMYQQRILCGLLQLLNTGDARLWQLCADRAARMAGWLRTMTHSCEEIGLFNDAATNIYPPTKTLLDSLEALDIAPRPCFPSGPHWAALEQSGYFAVTNQRGDDVFMDAGEIGPTYQPGHAHADFLAIESCFAGQRFIVDGGNKDYEVGAERSWARSAQAHSTVFVSGEEPLELWCAFRVGRRGSPADTRHRADKHTFSVSSSHTGYHHLDGRPTPHRHLLWHDAGVVCLLDQVTCDRAYASTSQLRIDGTWSFRRHSPYTAVFERDGIQVYVQASTTLHYSPCRYYPRFGEKEPAHLLAQRFESGQHARVTWLVCRRADKRLGNRLLDGLDQPSSDTTEGAVR